MIIVPGRIYDSTAQREAFLSSFRSSGLEARRAPGCHDFVVAADPIELDRVNVYEEWDSESELKAFPGAVRADVSRHHVETSGLA